MTALRDYKVEATMRRMNGSYCNLSFSIQADSIARVETALANMAEDSLEEVVRYTIVDTLTNAYKSGTGKVRALESDNVIHITKMWYDDPAFDVKPNDIVEVKDYDTVTG